MKQILWLSLIVLFNLGGAREGWGQKGNRKFDCASGEKGRLEYQFNMIKDGTYYDIKDNKLDFSTAKREDSYLRVAITNISWSKGSGKIRITPTHIRQPYGFKPPVIKGSETSTIEIFYYVDSNIKKEGECSIDIEFVPYDSKKVDCQNTSDNRIKKKFTIIPPKDKLTPKGTNSTQTTTTSTTTDPPNPPELADVDKIKTLGDVLEQNPNDNNTKSKLTTACNNEFQKSKGRQDLNERKTALERFLYELKGCRLCNANFMTEVQLELDKVNEEIAKANTGTAPYQPTTTDNTNTKTTTIPVDKVDEEKAWDMARRNGGSEASFQKYRKDFPNGKYRDEALTQIGVIKAKDDAAVKELSNDLKNAETDCQLQYDAYNRYVNRKPAAHYTRMQSMANKKKKELAKTCGIVSQSGELAGKEGELRLTYINKEIKDPKEITLKIKQKGMELQGGKDILVDQLSSTESGQFEWILSELEGGETEVTVTAKAKATVGYYLMPDRPQRVRYVDGKIRITGGTPPLYMRIIRNGQLQPGKPKLDSRIIDFETSELFKEDGKYHIVVLDYTDAKVGELKHPELPRKGQDFALLNLLMAIMLTAIAAVTIFRFREDIKNWMRTKPALRRTFSLKSPDAARKEKEQARPTAENAKATHDHGSIIIRSAQQHAQEEDKQQVSKIVIKKADTTLQQDATPVVEAGAVNPAFLDSVRYKEFDLKNLWGDTQVQKVYMRLDVAAELDNQLRNLANRMDMSNAEGETAPHPEIGGFLLGQFVRRDNGYYVGLEKYVEAPTEKQDAYEIEFAQEAFTQLDAALENNPGMTLIGWFHTHPGHGCFLSTPDQKIQNGFFREPYQMALQIDTLSENQDFAIYAWKQNGTINNFRDRAANTWFSWEEVNRWRREMAKRLL